MRHKELEAFWKRCLMKTAAAPVKRGGGGGKGAVAEPEDQDPDITADPDADPDADIDFEKDKEDVDLDADADPDADPDKDDADADPDADADADEDPRDATITELRERLEALEKGGKKADEEPKAMSEDDWKKLEEDWGIAEKDGMPGNFGRKGIQQIFRAMGGMQQMFAKMLAKELGGFKKEAAISELAREKGFEDIKGYRKGMEEFLKDFDSSLHSDKNMLKKALTYARGLGATGKYKKALNSREQERKINAGGGHGKPGGKGGGKTVTLTSEQKQAAKMAKMSEQEYIKYLTTDNLEDIDLPE